MDFVRKRVQSQYGFLFQFVLWQFRFVTIWVLLQFEFFKIISLSHFMFSPYCTISTLWVIVSLSFVTILVDSSKRYFSLLLFSSQKIFLHYIVLSWFGFCYNLIFDRLSVFILLEFCWTLSLIQVLELAHFDCLLLNLVKILIATTKRYFSLLFLYSSKK